MSGLRVVAGASTDLTNGAGGVFFAKVVPYIEAHLLPLVIGLYVLLFGVRMLISWAYKALGGLSDSEYAAAERRVNR